MLRLPELPLHSDHRPIRLRLARAFLAPSLTRFFERVHDRDRTFEGAFSVFARHLWHRVVLYAFDEREDLFLQRLAVLEAIFLHAQQAGEHELLQAFAVVRHLRVERLQIEVARIPFRALADVQPMSLAEVQREIRIAGENTKPAHRVLRNPRRGQVGDRTVLEAQSGGHEILGRREDLSADGVDRNDRTVDNVEDEVEIVDHEVERHADVRRTERKRCEPMHFEEDRLHFARLQRIDRGVETLDMADLQLRPPALRRRDQLVSFLQRDGDRLLHKARNALFEEWNGDVAVKRRRHRNAHKVDGAAERVDVRAIRNVELLPDPLGRFGMVVHDPHELDPRKLFVDPRVNSTQMTNADNRSLHSALQRGSRAGAPLLSQLCFDEREHERSLGDEPPPDLAPPLHLSETRLDLERFDLDAELIAGGENLGEPVERRFLTALGGDPCEDPRSARLDFAEHVADPANPLTARVAVNRLWQALFGRGLVRTVDNMGKMGDPPTHPELLDFLAARFVEDGWSTKKTLRRLALSRAYRMSSAASEAAREKDPENALLSHMPLRRLRAEPIRDALLAVSGRLDDKMYGPSVDIYYAYAKGKTKGDTAKGPVDGDGRRSVYQEIRRNTHNPFLEVFDLPKPATTRGLRDVTNVPAQSLTMLNSPFVIGQAEVWAEALVERRRWMMRASG